jgi:alkylation response protein AidB-like acyl-CoA dehydrogenase
MSVLSQGADFVFQKSLAPRILTSLQFALERIDPAELETLPLPGTLAPYARRVLVDTPQLQIVAARWRKGAKCDLHGHSESTVLYRIISGTVEEERYVLRDGQYVHELELFAQNDESLLPAGSFHQLRALEETITLHAYSPRPDDSLSELNPRDRHLITEARRHSKAYEKPARIEFPQWGVKSSRHDKTVEKIAAELAPRWGKYEREAYDDQAYRVPFRVLEEMRSSGILAAPIPRYWGGLTASLTETARAITKIAKDAPAAALALVMPLGNAATTRIPLSAVPRDQAPTLRENQRWIAEQVTRGRILAVANSEPDSGGHLSQTKTIASRGIDGNYYLTGQKTFATLGPDADFFLCAARTAVDTETPAGTETTIRVEGYFVHRDSPGVTLDDNWDAVGMRPTASVGLDLEYAPAERIYAYPGALESVNARHWSTLLFSAVFLGIGQAALAEGIRNAGHSPWARVKLAENALAFDAAAGYLEATCEAETWPMPQELLDRVQRVKTFVTQTVVQTATQVAIVSGERSYSAHHPVYRLLADALAGPLLRPPVGNAMETIMDQLIA